MSIVKSILGYRKFWKEEKIRDIVAKSKNFNQIDESVERSRSLLIFETSKQRTWLVSTSHRLYCVLDDIRKDRPKLQWSMSKTEIAPNSNYDESIKIKPETEKTGLVDIGTKHKNWLYSTRLFTSSGLDSDISNLLKRT